MKTLSNKNYTHLATRNLKLTLLECLYDQNFDTMDNAALYVWWKQHELDTMMKYFSRHYIQGSIGGIKCVIDALIEAMPQNNDIFSDIREQLIKKQEARLNEIEEQTN